MEKLLHCWLPQWDDCMQTAAWGGPKDVRTNHGEKPPGTELPDPAQRPKAHQGCPDRTTVTGFGHVPDTAV